MISFKLMVIHGHYTTIDKQLKRQYLDLNQRVLNVLLVLQNFVATGCMEHLDFFPDWAMRAEDFNGLKQLQYGRSYRSLTNLPKALCPFADEDSGEIGAQIPSDLAIAIRDASSIEVNALMLYIKPVMHSLT